MSYYCVDLKVKVYVNNVRKSPEKTTLTPSLKNKRGQARSHWAGIGFRKEGDTVTDKPQRNGTEKITCKRHKAGHYEHQHNAVGVEKIPPFFKFETTTVTSDRVPEVKHWSRAPQRSRASHLSTDIIWWGVHVSLVKYCCFLLFGITIIFLKKTNKKQTK